MALIGFDAGTGHMRPGRYRADLADIEAAFVTDDRFRDSDCRAEMWAEWVEAMQAPVEKPTDGLAAEGDELFAQKGCAGCHQVDGEYEEVATDAPSAPNLTKLFTRDCFAGCIYDLDDRNELEAWLRNPQRKDGSLMVIGELTEDEIDRLYAYLETLR